MQKYLSLIMNNLVVKEDYATNFSLTTEGFPHEKDQQKCLRKSAYEYFEVKVKDEIVVKEEPISIEGVEIKHTDLDKHQDMISFKGSSYLAKHGLTQTGDTSYQGNLRDKTLPHEKVLIEYQMIHTGDKSYNCSQCKKAFSSKIKLMIHLRTHTGEKPYQCRQCAKAFSQNSTL
ncbi:unnamed protein product, partial [Meganyctiphanes norvegica]